MYNATNTLKCTERNSDIFSCFKNTLWQFDRIQVLKNDTLRIKVTNNCPLTCNFCHHEGNLKSKNLVLNQDLIHGLKRLHTELKLMQAHLTGGEPTSYPHCRELISELKSIGYRVKMTSNGQFDSDLIMQLKNAGLDGVNFSVHTLDPQKLCSLQIQQKNNVWGLHALNRQLRNIQKALESGLEVKINTVVQNDSDIHDTLKIKDHCKNMGVSFRILNDLKQGSFSIKRIDEVLKSMSARLECINLVDKSSSYSLIMISQDGFKFKIKCIRKNILETLCEGCKERNNCMEWFYGIRIEQADDTAVVRLCMQRQDYPAIQTFEEFFTSKQFWEIL
ncbi:MAG: radical SAM protein [Candidatus Jettenia caeni]|nr:radical SAM protein [Candidatus Jettenia caeni]WKZ17039.1 MAG: radical SAM protein [Candidatus Jettenia caeni]